MTSLYFVVVSELFGRWLCCGSVVCLYSPCMSCDSIVWASVFSSRHFDSWCIGTFVLRSDWIGCCIILVAWFQHCSTTVVVSSVSETWRCIPMWLIHSLSSGFYVDASVPDIVTVYGYAFLSCCMCRPGFCCWYFIGNRGALFWPHDLCLVWCGVRCIRHRARY